MPSISQSSPSPSQAIQLACSLGADYIVIGGLTVFGDTISTDAQVFDVTTGSPQVSYHQVGVSQSEVIHHVDAFSAKVNLLTLLGISPSSSAARGAPTAPSAANETENARRHPEALLETGRKPAPVIGAWMARVRSEPWISRAFKTEISSVAVGDVADINENGKAEIFVTNLPAGGDPLRSFVLE